MEKHYIPRVLTLRFAEEPSRFTVRIEPALNQFLSEDEGCMIVADLRSRHPDLSFELCPGDSFGLGDGCMRVNVRKELVFWLPDRNSCKTRPDGEALMPFLGTLRILYGLVMKFNDSFISLGPHVQHAYGTRVPSGRQALMFRLPDGHSGDRAGAYAWMLDSVIDSVGMLTPAQRELVGSRMRRACEHVFGDRNRESVGLTEASDGNRLFLRLSDSATIGTDLMVCSPSPWPSGTFLQPCDLDGPECVLAMLVGLATIEELVSDQSR